MALTLAISNQKYGARDANAVIALLDPAKVGTEEGRKAELERVKASYPGLFYSLGSANGGAQGGDVQVEATGLGRLKAAYEQNAAARSR